MSRTGENLQAKHLSESVMWKKKKKKKKKVKKKKSVSSCQFLHEQVLLKFLLFCSFHQKFSKEKGRHFLHLKVRGRKKYMNDAVW